MSTTNGELTFAEAMGEAVNGHPVEWLPDGGGMWVPFDHARLDRFEVSVQEMWDMHKFRRWRRRPEPKRNRVQQMAAEHYEDTRAGVHLEKYAEEAMSKAIRAVCQYLHRPRQIEAAIDIEREFLESR